MNINYLLDIIQSTWIKSLGKQQKGPNPPPIEFIFYP